MRGPTVSIGNWIRREFEAMSRFIGDSTDGEYYTRVLGGAMDSVEEIHRLLIAGEIRPWAPLRLSESDDRAPPVQPMLRIGVFPIAGNPPHWGHVLCGLSAIALLRLDKVVYVVAGSDRRKPHLMPEEVRHRMACDLLAAFWPYLVCAPPALGSSRDGEMNLFRILGLNRGQPMHAYYLAGSDHCHRFDPATGKVDTIQKMECHTSQGSYGFDGLTQQISVAFFLRGNAGPVPETCLDIVMLPGPPTSISSTDIRWALRTGHNLGCLAALPYAAYRHIPTTMPKEDLV